MRTMPSKFSSRCKACGKFIDKGETIAQDTSGRWVHLRCATNSNQPDGELDIADIVEQATRTAPTDNTSNEDAEAIAREVEKFRNFKPSPYQAALADWVVNGTGNGICKAKPGSGKSTTLAWVLSMTRGKVAAVVFNKHNVAPLQRKMAAIGASNVHVSTVHSLLLSSLRRVLGRITIDENKTYMILDDYYPVGRNIDGITRAQNRQKRQVMARLVSLAKGILLDAGDPAAVSEAIERYGVDANGDEDELIALLPDIMERSRLMTSVCDFDDMIWLPVVLNIKVEQFDWILLDEAQDMNLCQITALLASLAPGGRFLAVGDENQSLYGFRGADTDAMPRLQRELNAKVLPLSISYRLPLSHIKLIKPLLPDIEAWEHAKEGLVADIRESEYISKLAPGDMVLCRTNAPLVSPAFECIRRGLKATIRGREIGKGIVLFIEKFKADDLGALDVLMGEYFAREYHRLIERGKDASALLLEDKVETIRVVMAEVETVGELISKISALFDDAVTGVVFSSIHRAKGLEAERVFILHPELMPHPKAREGWEMVQERNCEVVAKSRSLNELYFVR